MVASLEERTLACKKIAPNRAKSYPLLADQDLVHLVERGDPGAFACLYGRHARAAYLLARRVVGERVGRPRTSCRTRS